MDCADSDHVERVAAGHGRTNQNGAEIRAGPQEVAGPVDAENVECGRESVGFGRAGGDGSRAEQFVGGVACARVEDVAVSPALMDEVLVRGA